MARRDTRATIGPNVRALACPHPLSADLLLLLQQDRLSTLPAELLEWIFELAHAEADIPSKVPKGAPSRALLPHDRNGRFRRIEFFSMKSFRRFFKLVKRRRHVGAAVRELLFFLDFPTLVGIRVELKEFFSLFPRLARVDAGPQCDAISDLLLSNEGAPFPFTLTSILLTLDCEKEHPCDPLHLLSLNHRPSISSLIVDLNDLAGFGLGEVKVAPNPSTSPLQHVTTLQLQGSWCGVPGLDALVNVCTSVRYLTIACEVNEPDFYRLLPHINLPLTSLSLVSSSMFTFFSEPVSDSDFAFCDSSLPRFASTLTHLHLEQRAFDPSTLTSHLLQLPHLTSLTFGRGALPSISSLLSLVSGSTKHPTLRRLILNNLSVGRTGWRLADDGRGKLHYWHCSSKQHVGPGWVVPEYTDPEEHFSSAGVEELARVGRENDVEIGGTAIDGVDVYRAWRVEAVDCCVAAGEHCSIFTSLDKFLGKEEADKVLQERGLKRRGQMQ